MRAICTLMILGLLAPLAQAQSTKSEKTRRAEQTEPRVLHTPLRAVKAGKALRVQAEIAGDWRLERVELRVRGKDGQFTAVPFERDASNSFVAVVPAGLIEGPTLDYAITSVDRVGERRDHFASEARPHSALVVGQTEAQRQTEQLARYDGKRSRALVRAQVTAYGSHPADDEVATERFSDRSLLLVGEYRYRPLKTIHDFRFGVGVLRSDLPTVDGEAVRSGDAPGMNYGYGELNLELHRWFSAGARLVLGATEKGFSAGAAGILRVGDIAATHFAAEVEGISDLGTRTDLRFHLTTLERFPLAMGIEFTDRTRSADLARELDQLDA